MSAHALPAADEDLAAMIAARTPQSVEGAHVACTQLYARHAPSLLLFLARHVSVAERDDLHQVIWTRVWQKLPELFDGGDFRAWLFAIARNCVVDHSRKHSHHTCTELQTLPDDQTQPAEDQLVEEERMAQLRRCLEYLDPQSRQIVVSRMAGLSYAEICEATGLPALTAHKRFSKAKHQLMHCLQCSLRRRIPA